MPENQDSSFEIDSLIQRLASLRRHVEDMELLVQRYRTAERSLRESEERFRLLVESVEDYAIFMLDTEGHIVSWNPGAQNLKGYTPEEIIGQHFSRFYTAEDRAINKPQRALELASTTGRYAEEGWRVRKDGVHFWANLVLTPIHDDQGRIRGFAKVTRDMTKRKQTEEERERLLLETQQAVRLRDEFLAMAAHELKTPMTSLLGGIQLHQRHIERGEPNGEREQERVRRILDQALRLQRLINSMLDLTMLQEGRLLLEHSHFDLAVLVTQLLEEVRPTLRKHHLKFYADRTPLVIDGDRFRMEQVIQNLLQNAIKYSPHGGTVEVRVERDEQHAVLTVRDQGIGIPADDQPHIFERFFRASNVSRDQHSGMGVGLYIVREVIVRHGGTIDGESSEGAGSSFIVRLPLAQGANADEK